MTRSDHSDTTAVLAVDLGKTGCRAALWTDDAATPVVREGIGAPGLATPGGVDAAEDAIRRTAEAATTACGSPQLRAIGIGAAGVAAAPGAAAELLGRLRTSLPWTDVVLASDAITSHAGALAGGVGVVLAAGTGVVAVAVGSAGRFLQVDGWGPSLGDSGSGAWIGRAGLQAALRSFDGRGPDTALRAAAQQSFGDDLRQLPAIIGQDTGAATMLARFAPAVATAAAAGDLKAGQILADAARALAETIITAARHIHTVGKVPVAITGGLRHLGPGLLDQLEAALEGSDVPLAVRDPAGGSLDGARRLALHRDTALEPFLHRAVDAPAAAIS